MNEPSTFGVEVLFFAIARERVGRSVDHVEVAPGTTVGELFALLSEATPELEALRPYIRFAVNEHFVDHTHPLGKGDVVALIPPVSGGGPHVSLTEDPIDVTAVEALVCHESCGAVLTFKGTVRSNTQQHRVLQLEYEAYGTMALKQFAQMAHDAMSEHEGLRVAICHRLGTVAIGEVAVVIAVSSPHRASAFEACRTLIERMKADVPIFKRESRGDGSIWVGMGS